MAEGIIRPPRSLPALSIGSIIEAAEIVVSFILDRTGKVLASRVVRGSGDPSFDAAALDMMSRASPVPPSTSSDRR